jgi:hypothetical protein
MRHPDERDNYLDAHRRNELSPHVSGMDRSGAIALLVGVREQIGH